MDDAGLRLDGNAAAGLLREVFAVEMTAATATCAGCGAAAPFGAVDVYAHAPGTVLRCRPCGAVLACLVRVGGGRLLVDLSGLRTMEIPAGSAEGRAAAPH